MILQYTRWVEFADVGTITVPLVRPSVERSILVAGIIVHSVPAPAIASVRDSTGQRWRCANTTIRPTGKLDVWWTATRVAGATAVIAITANGIPASGHALVLEAMARIPGDVIQLAHDIVCGLPRLTRLQPPLPAPPPEPDDPDLAVWARFAGAMQDGASCWSWGTGNDPIR